MAKWKDAVGDTFTASADLDLLSVRHCLPQIHTFIHTFIQITYRGITWSRFLMIPII